MCSSSPMRSRSGSADRVVLPVPDNPNRMALSPPVPTLAEQCIESCPFCGCTKFMTVNMVFLFTPQ